MPKIRISKTVFRGLTRCPNCSTLNNSNEHVCKNDACNTVFKSTISEWDKVVAGLGKATMRGIKRCPKCGTMNGCKGNVCKNKDCNALLKDSISPKKLSETCKLDTGTFTKVYSVRVRDKGPECRGFVQLPLDEGTDIIQNSALCFVDHCQGNFKTRVLQCHERSDTERAVACNHIGAALKCVANAIPLGVSTDVLEAMSIQPQVKKEFWTLVMESSGPAVQRVSRDAMAVKCRVSTKFPLGFLHTTFVAGRSDEDLQFSCPCPGFRETSQGVPSNGRCVHFYACICAFVNQDALREEFSAYIRLELSVGLPDEPDLNVEENRKEHEVDFTSLMDCCHVEILQESMSAILSDVGATDETILGDGCVLASSDEVSTILSESDHRVSSILTESMSSDAIVFSTEDSHDAQNAKFELGRATLDAIGFSGQDSVILGSQTDAEHDINLTHLVPLFMETVPLEAAPPIQSTSKKKGTIRPQFTFLEWLGMVTESINQHMHYQCSGKSNAIVIQTPSKFFEKLKERMYRSSKKLLSSNVTVFNRTDSVPIGTFVKHSWMLTSRYHVKAVFDTPQMPLKLVRSFVRTSNCGYAAIDERECSVGDGTPLFKTYLRVGLHRGETAPVPFQLDWIPDLLPVSHIGELGIKFEFGHMPCLLADVT